MTDPRPILELSTAELYSLAQALIGHELPPLLAIENEDWGRDYLLQALASLPADVLEGHHLTWEPAERK